MPPTNACDHVSDEDFAQVRPESTRVIDLVQFTDASAIDPIYVERPYYLAPDGNMASQSFAVIREGMKGKAGIGKLALYGREYLVAVQPKDNGLVIYTLRHAGATILTLDATADATRCCHANTLLRVEGATFLKRPLELQVKLHALQRERVANQQLGIQPRAFHAAFVEELGRALDDFEDGQLVAADPAINQFFFAGGGIEKPFAVPLDDGNRKELAIGAIFKRHLIGSGRNERI